MATPSRQHWTKMFMTKHTCNQDCQTPCPRCPTNTSSAGPGEERTQELKPRWTPKPEQVRILQYIFDSGNITPTREEIRDIRAQLQEYGEVGEANVFYWFQNRKSRNKSKKRHSTIPQTKVQTNAAPPLLPYSSSACFQSLSSPPTAAFCTKSPLTWPAATTEPFLSSDPFLPEGQLEGFGSSDPRPRTNVPFGGGDHDHQTPGGDSGSVANEMMMMNYQNEVPSYSNVCDDEMYNYSASMPSAVRFDAGPSDSVATGTSCVWSSISQPEVQGLGSAIGGEPVPDMVSSSTAFINDVAFDVGFGPFNVREVFGGGAMLIHSSGDPIITDDMGFCLQPLQHGAFYYLVHRGAS